MDFHYIFFSFDTFQASSKALSLTDVQQRWLNTPLSALLVIQLVYTRMSSVSNFTNNISMNITDVYFPLLKQPVHMVVILSLAYGVVFLFALLGNVSVIAVMYRDKRFHSVTYVFLVNLAIADVMVALFCLPVTLMTNLFNGKLRLICI